MENRALGNEGLEVSALGLGCMGIDFGCGTTVQKHADVLRPAVQSNGFPYRKLNPNFISITTLLLKKV